MRPRILFTLLVVGVASGIVWAKTAVDATWQEGTVSVDASAEEWHGSMTFLPGPGMHLGVRNDDEYLYLCLYSPDRRTARQIMMQGLVFRFDAKNADPMRIQFPIGMFEDGQPRPMPGEQDRERMRERMYENLDSFLLLETNSRERRRLLVDNDLGIEVRAGEESGSFVLEMKLPLLSNDAHPYAIGGSADRIGLRIDTPEIDREAMRSKGGMRGGMGGGGMGGGGRGGGGMGGRGGGMGGGMGGGRSGGRGGGDRPQMPEPLHAKVKIQLASAP